ncbi:MAG: hypothetical protein VR70_04010 [Rhodospirillaceae bacterium BRH_c57]|nr:MAG: hypothetical protein VR70_04010 [Rhodospirillaceae bacterium BRH_c57]
MSERNGEKRGGGKARLLVGTAVGALIVGVAGYAALTKHADWIIQTLEGAGAPKAITDIVGSIAGRGEISPATASKQDGAGSPPTVNEGDLAPTTSAAAEVSSADVVVSQEEPVSDVSGKTGQEASDTVSVFDRFEQASESVEDAGPPPASHAGETIDDGKVYGVGDVDAMTNRVRDQAQESQAAKRADPDALPWEGYNVSKPKSVEEVARERAEAQNAQADTWIGSEPVDAIPTEGGAGLTYDELVSGRSLSKWMNGALWEADMGGVEVARRKLPAASAFEVEDTRVVRFLPPRSVPDINVSQPETGMNVVRGAIALPKAGKYRFDLHLKIGDRDFGARGEPRCNVRLDVGDATVFDAAFMKAGVGNSAVREGIGFEVPDGKEGLHEYILEYSCYGYLKADGEGFSAMAGATGSVPLDIADGTTVFTNRDFDKMAEYWSQAYQAGTEQPVEIGLRLLEPGKDMPRPLGDGDLYIFSDIKAEFLSPLKVELEPGVYGESYHGPVTDEKWDIRGNPDLTGYQASVQDSLAPGKLPFFDRSGIMGVRVYRGVMAVRESGKHAIAISLESGGEPHETSGDLFYGTRRCVTALRMDRGWGMSFPSPTDQDGNPYLAPWHEGMAGREIEPLEIELEKGLHKFALYVGCRPGMDGLEAARGMVRVDADWRVSKDEPQLYASLWMKHDNEPALRMLGEGDLFKDRDYSLPIPKVDFGQSAGKGAEMGILSFDDFDDAPAPGRGVDGRPSDLGGAPDGLDFGDGTRPGSIDRESLDGLDFGSTPIADTLDGLSFE